MTADTFLFIALFLYLMQVFIFLIGVRRTRDTLGNHTTPLVSVIIAARNEEDNIRTCLQSVSNQTYPRSLYEIIVVDDDSSDGTNHLCQSLSRTIPNLIVISTSGGTTSGGKTNALIVGIEESKGELVFITDADCVVPPTWIESTVRRYDKGIGIVGGLTLQRATGPFEGMQSLDWTYLLGIASAAASLGSPLSTIGNNLSFRRRAYDDVGGYRSIGFSVTEDYALFQAIVKSGKWDYLYPIDPALLVMSTPCRTLKELMRQKHRWGKGGLDMTLTGFLIMAIGFLLHSFILVPMLYGSFFGSLVALAAKWIADYMFLRTITRRVGKESHLQYFYYFELYYHLYVLLLPFIVFFGGKVIWKERKY